MRIDNQTTYNSFMNIFHKMQGLNYHRIHFIRSSKNCKKSNKIEILTVPPKKFRRVEMNCDAPLQSLVLKQFTYVMDCIRFVTNS